MVWCGRECKGEELRQVLYKKVYGNGVVLFIFAEDLVAGTP